MVRETLDRKLSQLKDDVLVLGSMVEQAILKSVDALKRRDAEAARRLYAADAEINQKRFEIESACLIAIATQQPLAHDLRILAAILEVITELERMGDYAKGIARICVKTSHEPPVKPLVDIPKMAELVASMLHSALDAFVNEDIEQARQIPSQDDAVDVLYNQIHRELITLMLEDPTIVDRANMLMWAAHNLERTADRVTNICERTIFIVTGVLDELDVSDDEWVEM